MAGQRKRGEELDEAILQAAREIVEEDGYSALTFQNVAKRAQTGKAVIYRRWDTPFDLMLDASRGNRPEFTLDAFNTGNVRQDLHRFFDLYRFENLDNASQLLIAMIVEAVKMNPRAIKEINDATEGSEVMLTQIFDQAIARGEVTKKPSSLRMQMAVNQLRMRLAMHQLPVVDDDIDGLVEELLL